MYAMNHHVAKMQFVLLKIKMLSVNVRQDTEVIQSQKLVVNRLMHVPNVQSLPYAKLHRLEIKFANAHKDILVIQIRQDASQLVNVHMEIQIVRIVLAV